jgi:hypothetical protein
MPKRPTAVLVIAICHFFFGGIGLSCAACSGVLGASGLGMEFAKGFNPDVERQAEKAKANERLKVERVPGYRFYTAFDAVMTWVLSAAMVAAGFGLLWVKRWGYWLSTGYAMASIFVGIVAVFYNLSYLGPIEEEIRRNNPPPGMNAQQAEIEQTIAPVANALGPCCLTIYPIAVLVVMFLPSTLAAFSRGPGKDDAGTDDD